MKGSEASGHIDYVPEGFILHWDEIGLRIEVTDYHAGILKLPWELLLDLAARVGRGENPQPGAV